MALVDLLHAFERDTDAEVRAIRARADADVARLDAEAAAVRTTRIATATAAFAAERQREADTRLAAADRAARTEVLAARAAMLARVHSAVAQRLPALVTANPLLQAELVAAAIACAGDEHGTLRCPPALEATARAAAPPSISVEVDDAAPCGAVIELVSGTHIEATLEALLAREWPRLACEALAMERAS